MLSFLRSIKPDATDKFDTAEHNTVPSAATERRLINVATRLRERPQCIIKRQAFYYGSLR